MALITGITTFGKVMKPSPTQSRALENEIMGRPARAGNFYSNVDEPNIPGAADGEGLIDALTQVIEAKNAQINTNMPATIVSYDAARNRAIVKVSIPKRLADDEELDGPQIVEVPIVWPASGGGKASFTMPLESGDGVMLAVQQRSLENWLSGNSKVPDDPRQFDLSDSVAIAGCSSGGTVAHDKDVVLKFNKTEVRITPDNTIIIGNENGGITIDEAGNMMIKAQTINIDTPMRSFVLEQHVHSNPEGGNVGPPQ